MRNWREMMWEDINKAKEEVAQEWHKKQWKYLTGRQKYEIMEELFDRIEAHNHQLEWYPEYHRSRYGA